MAGVVVPGCAHHVTQRGNHPQTVFFRDNDQEVYLHLLSKYMDFYHADLIGYCLMGNHVHLILIPELQGNHRSMIAAVYWGAIVSSKQ